MALNQICRAAQESITSKSTRRMRLTLHCYTSFNLSLSLASQANNRPSIDNSSHSCPTIEDDRSIHVRPTNFPYVIPVPLYCSASKTTQPVQRISSPFPMRTALHGQRAWRRCRRTLEAHPSSSPAPTSQHHSASSSSTSTSSAPPPLQLPPHHLLKSKQNFPPAQHASHNLCQDGCSPPPPHRRVLYHYPRHGPG